MNIGAISANYNEIPNIKPAPRSTGGANLGSAGTFGESLRDVARAVNMQVASGNNSATLQFNRQGKEVDTFFSFSDAVENQVEDYVGRINRLLGELPNKQQPPF